MISSRRNERIKTIRGLRSCKEELAFLEGPHLVEEMLSAGLRPQEVVATPDFLARPIGQRIEARLLAPPLIVTPSVMASLTDSVTPQGIVAVVEFPRHGVERLPEISGGLYLYLDRVQDPGNLGALIRSAEATSAAGVALGPGCAHPNHPKALRASSGSLLRMPVAADTRLDEILTRLSEHKPILVTLEPAGGEDLYETDLAGTLVLAVGSEGAGLQNELSARADVRITIPVAQPVESLNVAVAASVVLHELARRRRASRRKDGP